jgi:glycosyltransferase involved in cell wall biosynthesis
MPGLYRALGEAAPDLILTEGESSLPNDLAVALYARRHGVPYVWWGLGSVPGARPTGLRTVFGPLIRGLVRGAAGVACYSSWARRFYLELGARETTCRVIPNVLDAAGVEADIARRAPEAAARRAALGVAPGDLVLLTVGTIEDAKRIDLALRALALLEGTSPRRLHYWVVGDGPARAAAEAFARELGLSNVTFWGARYDDVALYFQMADLFVLPGLGGLALNQAMTHGLPAIAGPADGTEQDLLGDGTCGRLLTSVTPESLAAAIGELAGSDLRPHAENARARIRGGYTIAHQLDAFAALIAAAMAAHREAHPRAR